MAVCNSVTKWANTFRKQSKVLSKEEGCQKKPMTVLNGFYCKPELRRYMDGRVQLLWDLYEEIEKTEKLKPSFRVSSVNTEADGAIYDEEDDCYYDIEKYDYLNRVKAEVKVLREEIDFCEARLQED